MCSQSLPCAWLRALSVQDGPERWDCPERTPTIREVFDRLKVNLDRGVTTPVGTVPRFKIHPGQESRSNRTIKGRPGVPPQSCNAPLGALCGGIPCAVNTTVGGLVYVGKRLLTTILRLKAGSKSSWSQAVFLPQSTQTSVARLRWRPAASSITYVLFSYVTAILDSHAHCLDSCFHWALLRLWYVPFDTSTRARVSPYGTVISPGVLTSQPLRQATSKRPTATMPIPTFIDNPWAKQTSARQVSSPSTGTTRGT